MQRRLRERRRLREEMLLDLGALVYELHRQGRRAPELLQEKAAELSAIDDEVRALEEALGESDPGPAAPEQATEEVDAVDEYVVTRLEPEDEPAGEQQEHAVAEGREPRE